MRILPFFRFLICMLPRSNCSLDLNENIEDLEIAKFNLSDLQRVVCYEYPEKGGLEIELYYGTYDNLRERPLFADNYIQSCCVYGGIFIFYTLPYFNYEGVMDSIYW